jgi:hypothetical protein
MVLKDQFFNLSNLVRRNAPIRSEPDIRLDPELALSIRRSNVDMGRFLALVGVKMEPEIADSQHRRHSEKIPVTDPVVHRLSPNELFTPLNPQGFEEP